MLRFAPRYGRVSPCLVRPLPARAGALRTSAANDNAPAPGPQPSHWGENRETLEAALHLFAAHGLSAAKRAADEAAAAQRAGDLDKARWWIGVCRTLDRQLARGLRPVG